MPIRALQAELELSQAHYGAVLSASLDAIIVMDHEGKVVEFNPAAEAIFGFARADIVGKPLADHIIPAALRERHRIGLARYLATGVGPVVNQHIELPALRADGSEFPAELAIVPIAGSAPPEFMGFVRDITERKRAEQRRQFLMDELAHRGKNLLAVIQSVASRTLSEARPLAEARETLLRRIGALARSLSALTADGFEGAPVAAILRAELDAFSDRLDAQGPEVMLNPKAAQTFALLVHELATNAAKHGALSRQEGRIAVRWAIAGGRRAFRWEESGGPPVRVPARSGFGRQLLEQVVAGDFQAQPVMTFAAGGVRYEVDAPLAAVAAERAAGLAP
ncbi:MAG: sensor histidine kinase [Caulobacteraceae bacterium]